MFALLEMEREMCKQLRKYQVLINIHRGIVVKSTFFSDIIICFSLSLRQWHAFSVPELQNFLVILEKEESERVRAVEQKYAMYRQKLQQALQQHDP